MDKNSEIFFASMEPNKKGVKAARVPWGVRKVGADQKPGDYSYP
jgi:hypothetical protein